MRARLRVPFYIPDGNTRRELFVFYAKFLVIVVSHDFFSFVIRVLFHG